MLIKLYNKQHYSNNNIPKIIGGKTATLNELRTIWAEDLYISFKNHYDNKYIPQR